jgi:hypothetical protein
MISLADEFRGDLRDLYFFYYFAAFGLGAQRDQFIYAQKITRNALEKEYGTSQSYVNTEVAYLTVADTEYAFKGQAKESLKISFDDLIENSESDGPFHARLREYVVVLLAELWERRFRVALKRVGVDTRSDYWGSVVRLRHCILHNDRVLDRDLYDLETFGFLTRGKTIYLASVHLNRIVEKAFFELDRLVV